MLLPLQERRAAGLQRLPAPIYKFAGISRLSHLFAVIYSLFGNSRKVISRRIMACSLFCKTPGWGRVTAVVIDDQVMTRQAASWSTGRTAPFDSRFLPFNALSRSSVSIRCFLRCVLVAYLR